MIRVSRILAAVCVSTLFVLTVFAQQRAYSLTISTILPGR
jgi:hypothetical protein